MLDIKAVDLAPKAPHPQHHNQVPPSEVSNPATTVASLGGRATDFGEPDSLGSVPVAEGSLAESAEESEREVDAAPEPGDAGAEVDSLEKLRKFQFRSQGVGMGPKAKRSKAAVRSLDLEAIMID